MRGQSRSAAAASGIVSSSTVVIDDDSAHSAPSTFVLTSEVTSAIDALVEKASIPGAETMNAAFCAAYGLQTRPANESEGEARVEYFKSRMVRRARWGQGTLVAAGLAFPVSRGWSLLVGSDLTSFLSSNLEPLGNARRPMRQLLVRGVL